MSPCPFCDDPKGGQPCPACKSMTAFNEPVCSHCGQAMRSEMRWKIPVIILMFVVAIGVSVVVQLI